MGGFHYYKKIGYENRRNNDRERIKMKKEKTSITDKNIIIYGTGEIAKKIFHELENEGKSEQVAFFLDSLMSKRVFCGKEVHAPAFLGELDTNSFCYYLGTYTNTKSMREELFHHGILEENIIEVEDYAINSLEKNITAINDIVFFPEFDNSFVLEQIASEMEYLFPVIFDTGLMINASGQIADNYKNMHIQVVKELSFDTNTIILVWDKAFLKDKRLQLCKKVLCIDRSYFDIIDIRIFLRLNYLLAGKKVCNELTEISRKNMELFSGKFHKAYVVGNGPGCIEGIHQIPKPEPSLRIACNLFIKNKAYMEMLKPNLYAIADEAISTGKLNSYIEMIAEYITKHDCLLAAPNELAMAFIKRYPVCQSKVIAVGLNAKTISFPTTGHMQVYRKAYNVITALAIPIASSLCDDIYIMGCDGMKVEADNAWEYADGIPANAGIKRNVGVENWYSQYYRQHIQYMEEMIRYGTENGKQYHNISKSYIPVLNQLSQEKQP